MRIVFITVSNTALENLSKAYKTIREDFREDLDLKLYDARKKLLKEEEKKLIDDIIGSDLLFIDLMGSPSDLVKVVYQSLEKCKGNIVPFGNSGREYLRLGRFTAKAMKSKDNEKKPTMEEIKKMQSIAEKAGKIMPGKMRDMKNYSQIMKYFKIAEYENMLNLLYLLMADYGGIKKIPKIKEAKEAEDIAIINPQNRKHYRDLEDYYRDFPKDYGKPTVAILFYGHTYPTDQLRLVLKTKEKLELIANVIPIGIAGDFKSIEAKLRGFLIENTDLLINFMSFRLGAGPMGGDFNGGIKFLKDLDVPYFHPFFMTRKTIKDWEDSIQGSSPSEVLISVMLPELDGAIETFPIAGLSKEKYGKEGDVFSQELEVIEDRLEKLVEKTKSYLKLRFKANRDKKIAIIGYNYPPGEANIFGGAFLDTFESMEKILSTLKDEGYTLPKVKKEFLLERFSIGGLVNSGKYSDLYKGAIKYDKSNIDESPEMLKSWGEAPGEIMVDEKNNYLIPGIELENIFIGLQPSKGNQEDQEKNYHDKSIPPHYQYQSFYKWLRDEFKADAIIHVGTHGTLEFLKGKECGTSKECYPDQLIGGLAHIYLYYCGNPSEAIIAKRRSQANIVSYKAPAFYPCNLYGDYLELSDLIDEYNEKSHLNKNLLEELLEKILEEGKKLRLSDTLKGIEDELYNMKSRLIPEGLHIFGSSFSKKESFEYIKNYLKNTRDGNNGFLDLFKDYFSTEEEINGEVDSILEFYIQNQDLPNKAYIDYLNREDFYATFKMAYEIYLKAIKNNELEGLIGVLNGGYNEAKLAGDIYRNSDVISTGYNLYQFDPRKVPSEIAKKRGSEIAETMLEKYKREEGEYPLSCAVILWGLETSRTEGESFAQILSYLGVRIVKKNNSWENTFEIIPIEELKRPRIDVSINICGFFRDMFPNLIDLLDEVFNALYEIDEREEENFFKKNSNIIINRLINKGFSQDEAKKLGLARVFGPEEGGYGTNLTGLVENKIWKKESDLGENFISSLKYIYTKDLRGKNIEGLYEENLKNVDLVSQIRSNSEYEITDLDHYYEFFGGLSKSIENVKGKKAAMYISDTSQDKIITETVDRSIKRGIHTRTLNPQWIDSLLEHDYHGAQKISKVFENIMGLAATTNAVEEYIYSELHNKYIEDEVIRNKMIENNKYAYMEILEQMMEYYNRGYWNADESQIDKIKGIYLDIEDNIEESTL